MIRATAYRDYRAVNLVRVEDEPGLTVDALAAFADDALAGLAHRRLDFEVISAADRRRTAFDACGWTSTRLVWLRHAGGAAHDPKRPALEVHLALLSRWNDETAP